MHLLGLPIKNFEGLSLLNIIFFANHRKKSSSNLELDSDVPENVQPEGFNFVTKGKDPNLVTFRDSSFETKLLIGAGAYIIDEFCSINAVEHSVPEALIKSQVHIPAVFSIDDKLIFAVLHKSPNFSKIPGLAERR